MTRRPTASHYLKILLDAIFGPRRFINEVIWKRAHTIKGNIGQGAKHFGRSTDANLVFAKSHSCKFNQLYEPYGDEYLKRFHHVEAGTRRRYRTISMIGPGGAAKGNPRYEVMGVIRYWRYSKERMHELIAADRVVQSRPGAVPERKLYLDEGKGSPIQSLWTDLIVINPMAAVRCTRPALRRGLVIGHAGLADCRFSPSVACSSCYGHCRATSFNPLQVEPAASQTIRCASTSSTAISHMTPLNIPIPEWSTND